MTSPTIGIFQFLTSKPFSEALWLALLYWTLLHSPNKCSILTKADLQELEKINAWVITHSSPCSATCGLGLRTQELCPIGGTASISTTTCKMRTVRCLDTWQCGLKTQTAISGHKLVLDCLEEVMDAMGRFAFVVSWRFARGVITSDDSLFTRYEALSLDKVVLDPLREEDSGTYRCDVLDTGRHRVKRMYKGVRVISPNMLNLDFAKGLNQWEKPESLWPNITTITTGKLYPSSTLRNMVLVSVSICVALIAVIFLPLWAFNRKMPKAAAQPFHDNL
ncbi:transmembrane protein 81 [Triplophysa rosa]|uniref:transmembrane protein 81 n=1 Tax=Triplophysa rosa TaxID=992332 RepID=UPI0025460808|nr:transmembrane protein 81 [Triplophysa rosa]